MERRLKLLFKFGNHRLKKPSSDPHPRKKTHNCKFKIPNPFHISSSNLQNTALEQDNDIHYTQNAKIEVRPLIELPFGVICRIMAKVDAKSSNDVFKIRRCCKIMKEAGESHLVYRELDIFGLLNLPFHLHILDKRNKTLTKCKEHENLLLMFRDGVFDLFRDGDKTKLRLEGEQGQSHAIFMNAMIMLAERRENKEEALSYLQKFRKN